MLVKSPDLRLADDGYSIYSEILFYCGTYTSLFSSQLSAIIPHQESMWSTLHIQSLFLKDPFWYYFSCIPRSPMQSFFIKFPTDFLYFLFPLMCFLSYPFNPSFKHLNNTKWKVQIVQLIIFCISVISFLSFPNINSLIQMCHMDWKIYLW